jgi:hypothetical protein
MKKFLLALSICLTARATLVPSLSPEELLDQSQIIAHGRVTHSWSAWDGGHNYIWTHHQLEVIDSLRGPAARFVIVSEPGGELDGVGMKVSGALPYSVGEEVVVFLYRTPVGYLRAVGYGQGKYTVGSGARVHANWKAPLSTLEGLTVSEFKNRIREMTRPSR